MIFRIRNYGFIAIFGYLVLHFATFSFAADRVDFSGKYSSASNKGSENELALEVVQKETTIEVIRTIHGKASTTDYPIDGSEGSCLNSSGIAGKCKAHLKGKSLILESLVASKPKDSVPAMRFHTQEQWQLSSDLQTLTIKSTTDSPDAPAEISNVVFGSMSETLKYKRVKP